MIRTADTSFAPLAWLRALPLSRIALWGALWLNLNTGFWNIYRPQTASEWQLLIRALLPFAALPAALLYLIASRYRLRLPRFAPSLFLASYGCLAALAAVFSPNPSWSLYWATTFLTSIAVAWTFAAQRNPLRASRAMLHVTWAVTLVVAAIIAYTARDLVFGGASSAYGVITDLEGQSRSSGAARWAAVPGLVCLVRAWHSRRSVLIAFYLAAAGIAFYIVYRMQSRGAVLGAVAALAFALVIGQRLRRYALPFVLVAAVAVPAMESPEIVSERVYDYLRRGQTEEEFRSMTGRTRAYKNGLAAFEEAPLLGRGHWADRMIIGEHVHNSYLQALMAAGVVGGLPYLASWIAGWALFWRLHRKRKLLPPEDRVTLLEAGTVMMFFTIRSIPETTTAGFSVDLLVMAAVYVYFEVLALAVHARRPHPRPGRSLPARLRIARCAPQLTNA